MRVSILHLVASSRGGGATHVRDLALGLDPRRYASQVVMPEDGGHVYREDFMASDIPFHPMNIAAGFSLQAIRHIRRLLDGVEVVHVHGARAAFFGRLAAASLARRRPRIVYSVHGFAAPHYAQPRRGVLLAIERALAPITDSVIAVSYAERQALLAARVTRAERIRVVWHGIDVARFHRTVDDRDTHRLALGIPVDAPVITTVCRLDKPRDFDTLLQAFRKVVDTCPATHLLMVGNGPYRARIETRVSNLGLSSRVMLAGTRRDIPQILTASDILVLSTALWEGLPFTILEAMAAGLPVVASDVGGIAEAVRHTETGYIVPQRSPEALSEGLLRLLGNPEHARAMGERGSVRAQKHFTLERMTHETTAVYEDVLTPHGTGGC